MQQSAYATSASAKTPSNLVDILRQHKQYQPDALAYTFLADGEAATAHMTFGELDEQARIIGATLQHMGVTGERVLLLYPSSLDYIAAFFGCLYAGAVAVPMYPPHMKRATDRLQAVAADAEAAVALTTSALMPKTAQWCAQTPQLSRLNWLATDTLAAAAALAWSEPDLTDDALAFLQYTSGSIASPKGVMVSHGNLMHNQQMLQAAYEHGADTVYVSWLPLFHDMGLIGNVLQSLYVGVPCVLMPPISFLQRPVRWLNAISTYRATTSGGPNFAYDLCVRKVTAAQRAGLDLCSWTIAFNGAEPIRLESLERFAEVFGPHGFRREAFYPAYGLAEGTLMVTGGDKAAPPVTQTVKRTALEQNRVIATDPAASDAQTLVGCGHVRLGQRIVIVDPETRTACPPEQVGEIWVAGASIAQGYWQRPESTAETFQARLADTGEGPFLRTGDLGFLLQGELFVTGRLKDVLILRGANHYPQDIESTVEQCHAALRPTCGAAFTVEVEGEERLVVVQEVERCYQPRRNPLTPPARGEADGDATVAEPLDILQVLGTIRRAVAETHGLQVYAILLLRTGSILKTSSGKIQRRACQAAFLAQALKVVAAWQATPACQSTQPPRAITTARAFANRRHHGRQHTARAAARTMRPVSPLAA